MKEGNKKNIKQESIGEWKSLQGGGRGGEASKDRAPRREGKKRSGSRRGEKKMQSFQRRVGKIGRMAESR